MAMAVVIAMAIIGLVLPIVRAEEETVVEEQFVISGYSPREYAIKGQQEEELIKLIEKIDSFLRKYLDAKLFIVLKGSADIKGLAADNDELSDKRARVVASYLTARYSDAKISAWPAGDTDNERQVSGIFRLVRTIPMSARETEKPKESRLTNEGMLILKVGGIALLAILTIGAFKVRRKNQKQVVLKRSPVLEPVESDAIQSATGETSKEIWVTFSTPDDGSWEARVKKEIKQEGIATYISPFKHLAGKQVNFFEFSKSEISSSIARCWKNSKFSEQKQLLIEAKSLRQKM